MSRTTATSRPRVSSTACIAPPHGTTSGTVPLSEDHAGVRAAGARKREGGTSKGAGPLRRVGRVRCWAVRPGVPLEAGELVGQQRLHDARTEQREQQRVQAAGSDGRLDADERLLAAGLERKGAAFAIAALHEQPPWLGLAHLLGAGDGATGGLAGEADHG